MLKCLLFTFSFTFLSVTNVKGGCAPGQYDGCNSTCTDCGPVGDQYNDGCSGSNGPGASGGACKMCTRCEAGKYISGCLASSGPGVCQDCAVGKFSSLNHKVTTLCDICPVGYSTGGTAGNFKCIECEEGKNWRKKTFCLLFNFNWQLLCLMFCFFSGKYSDDDVVGGSCISCPTGYVSTTTSLCKAIDQKKYRPDPNVEKTSYCLAGHYCDGMNMLPCPPGNNMRTTNTTTTLLTTIPHYHDYYH